MDNIGLISLLKTFTNKEMFHFEKFLHSPYFTEGKRIRIRLVLRYFQILKKYYPGFNAKSFTKKFIYTKLYPHSKYNDTIFRKLNSDMLKLAQRFVVQLELESNRIDSDKYFIDQMYKRKIGKLFDSGIKSLNKYLEKLNKDEDYFYETYFLTKSLWDFYYGKKNLYKMNNLMTNINNFFIYVLLGSMRIYLWKMSVSRIMNKNSDLMLYEELTDYVERNKKAIEGVPQILFYFYLIKLHRTQDEKYFFELKTLAGTKLSSLTDLDKENLYIMMTNFCGEMILKGHVNFRMERFQLDDEFTKYLKKQKTFTTHVFYFLAAAKNANILGKYSWSQKLVKDFEKNFSPESKDFAVKYIRADLLFFRKKYDEAIENLSRINTLYSNEKQYVRNLMIQIYFETGSYESALSLIDTSKHFLKRDKHLSVKSRENSVNFIKFCEKLITLNGNKNKNEISLLRKTIEESKGVFNKTWLLDKLKF